MLTFGGETPHNFRPGVLVVWILATRIGRTSRSRQKAMHGTRQNRQ